jgi:hypothetical protein
LIKNAELKKGILSEADMEEEHFPTRYIMIHSPQGAQIVELMQMSREAHLLAGIKIKNTVIEQDGALHKTVFENDDEIWLVLEGARLQELSARQKADYANKIFIDYNCNDITIKDAINQLGLVGYMYPFALCKEQIKGDK